MAGGVRLAPGVTLEQVQRMFTAPLTHLTGRAGVTDLQRLAVDSKLVGPDGRANPQYLVPNTTPGEFGDVLFVRDRNTFIWNASLSKNLSITEKTRLQLFASFNNLLNHPLWFLGSPLAANNATNVFSTSFGIIGAPGSIGGAPTGQRSINLRATLSF